MGLKLRRWRRTDRLELDDEGSPGLVVALIAIGLFTFGLLSYWLNDMHMYGYGLFGP